MFRFMIVLVVLMALAAWRWQACRRDGLENPAKVYKTIFVLFAACWTLTFIVGILSIL